MTNIAVARWLWTLVLIACGALVLAACELDIDDPDATGGAGTRTATTAAAAPGGAVQVDSVVDGDTIRVEIEGEVYRVRLILVNTPEVQGEPECYGAEAAEYLEELLPPGALVELERDVSDTDRFGRLLRYVYLEDGTMVNGALLEGGYAHVVTFPPDLRYVDEFRDIEREARSDGRGLWSACPADATPGR